MPASDSVYDIIDRKGDELRQRGIGEEDISRIINAELEYDMKQFTSRMPQSKVNRESLYKVMDRRIVDGVDALLKQTSRQFNRVYPESTFYGLCLHLSSTLERRKAAKQRLSNERILDVVQNHREEYAICMQFASAMEKELGVPMSIDEAVLLTLFLCWRFRLSFAAGAMASLIFDVTTTTSLLVILGQEIDLNIVAALLTIIGYSLNDTIVIYDRIRETLRRENPDSPRPLPEIIQEALGDTMSRTLLTAGTTLVAALALFLLGGPVIYGFALTMLIGVFMGTISSLFVAAPMLPLFGDTLSFKTAVTLGVFERPGEHGVV